MGTQAEGNESNPADVNRIKAGCAMICHPVSVARGFP